MNKSLKTIFVAALGSISTNLIAQTHNAVKTYNIGILLPFSSDGSVKENKNQEAILDYYAGAKEALKQLESDGFKANVYSWDANQDSAQLEKVYASSEFQSLDVLIGPIDQKQIPLITKRSKTMTFSWISPLRALNLGQNGFNYNFFAPDSLRMRGLAYALSDQFKKHRFCLIGDGSPQSKKDIATLKFVLTSLSSKRKITIHTVAKGKITPELPKKDSLILVNAFTSQSGKVPLNDAISTKKSSYVIGHFQWYEKLATSNEVSESKILYPAINFMDENDTVVQNYVKRFTAINEGEPSRFGFQGYDQMIYIGYGLMSLGSDFLVGVPSANSVGLINTIRTHRVGKRFFNIGVRLIHIEDNQDHTLFK